MKTEMDLEEAEGIAALVMRALRPVCERIEVSGSVRRRKSQVGDIEVVAVPRQEVRENLWGELVPVGHWPPQPMASIFGEGIDLIKNGDRFKQIRLPAGICLDLFLVLPPAQWGVIQVIRTGPKNFSRWMVTKRAYGGALPSNCQVKDGVVRDSTGAPVLMPEEMDFFAFCGIDWLEPWERDR